MALAQPDWYGTTTDVFAGTLGEAVSRMFSTGYLEDYSSFASTVHSNDRTSMQFHFLNLEYIHNNGHNITGGWKYILLTDPKEGEADLRGIEVSGAGHMSDIPVAAFDPVFWFHHSNIDRCLAIWQAVNYNSWFIHPPGAAPPPDDPRSNSPLYPFSTDLEGHVWDSDKGRNYKSPGHEYDDLVPNQSSLNPDGSINKEKYKSQVQTLIHNLYPDTSGVAKRFMERQSNQPETRLGIDRDRFNDYVINVLYDRYALGGLSYTINFYLSKDAHNKCEVSLTPKDFCGAVFTFSNSPARCGNCAQDQAKGRLSEAQILLTSQLLKRFERDRRDAAATGPAATSLLRSLHPDDVEPFLEKHLTWEFVAYGGAIQDSSNFPKTRIVALKGAGTLPSASRHANGQPGLPRFAEYTPMFGATKGKLGGVSDGEDSLPGTTTANA